MLGAIIANTIGSFQALIFLPIKLLLPSLIICYLCWVGTYLFLLFIRITILFKVTNKNAKCECTVSIKLACEHM